MGCAHLQAAQKVGLVAQTGLAQSVAGLGAGTVNATQFSADTSPDNLNVRPCCHLLSASTAPVRSMRKALPDTQSAPGLATLRYQYRNLLSAAASPPCQGPKGRLTQGQMLVYSLLQAQLQAAVLSGSAPPPPPPNDDSDDGLSGGQIAGIVIGCVAGVTLFAVLA